MREKTKKEHYVPRCYLDRWGNNKGQVVVYHLYWVSTMYQINSVKTYLYDLISEATYLHKFKSDLSQNHSEEQFVEVYRGLELPLKLYYLAYQKYIIEREDSFAAQLISIVCEILPVDESNEFNEKITRAFVSMVNDLGYMRGSKKQSIWKFSREELLQLFVLEAELLKKNSMSPMERPMKGVLKMQISNFILKSRNGYNEDYICKYLPNDVARESIKNHQI